VKTQKFDAAKYVGDPINAVKIFNEKEADELTLLDINATVEGRGPDFELLKDIASESRMPLCYGGGITNADQAAKIISLGYEKISVSAAAVERPELISELATRIGTQSVVMTLDVRREGLMGGHTLYTHNAKRKHRLDIYKFIVRAEELGAGEIVMNSIDRDGMMQGYDLRLAKRVRDSVNTPLSFVGGAGEIKHLQELIDVVGGPVGAMAGSMFVFKGKYRAVLISYARPDE
jgi:cyclase